MHHFPFFIYVILHFSHDSRQQYKKKRIKSKLWITNEQTIYIVVIVKHYLMSIQLITCNLKRKYLFRLNILNIFWWHIWLAMFRFPFVLFVQSFPVSISRLQFNFRQCSMLDSSIFYSKIMLLLRHSGFPVRSVANQKRKRELEIVCNFLGEKKCVTWRKLNSNEFRGFWGSHKPSLGYSVNRFYVFKD